MVCHVCCGSSLLYAAVKQAVGEVSHVPLSNSLLHYLHPAPCPMLKVPLAPCRTRSILVLERLVGVPLTDLEAVRAATRSSGRDPEAILVNALNTWFASVMGAETFHADVHAGGFL